MTSLDEDFFIRMRGQRYKMLSINATILSLVNIINLIRKSVSMYFSDECRLICH